MLFEEIGVEKFFVELALVRANLEDKLALSFNNEKLLTYLVNMLWLLQPAPSTALACCSAFKPVQAVHLVSHFAAANAAIVVVENTTFLIAAQEPLPIVDYFGTMEFLPVAVLFVGRYVVAHFGGVLSDVLRDWRNSFKIVRIHMNTVSPGRKFGRKPVYVMSRGYGSLWMLRLE